MATTLLKLRGTIPKPATLAANACGSAALRQPATTNSDPRRKRRK
jgi:hypothetical protein